MLITPEKIMFCLRKLADAGGAQTVDTVVRRDQIGIRAAGPSDGELAQVYSALASRGLVVKEEIRWGVYGYTITDLGRAVLKGEAEIPPPPNAIPAGESFHKSYAELLRDAGMVQKVGR